MASRRPRFLRPAPHATRAALVRIVRRATLLGVAVGMAAACGISRPESPELPGAVRVPASQFPFGDAPATAANPAGPVTHLGRHVFPQCHKMVVAEVVSVSRAGLGTEIARVRERELLWGPPEEDDTPFNVVCGAVGLTPPPGAAALLLLRLLPAGGYQAVEVAPLEGPDGDARLQAFRIYLRIEGVEDPAHRRGLLLGYLRSAVAASATWTRANAVREYAAFAEAFPGALAAEDGAALSRAMPGLKDGRLRRMAQRALDAVPTVRKPPRTTPDGPRETPRPALAEFERRFADPKADAAARREALLDAATRLDRAALPLVLRALDDRDAVVREAAAAVAGEAGMTEASASLLDVASLDPSQHVRRTSVLALGHLRATGAVEFLAGLAASDPSASRDALFALARIRDDAAMAKLRTLRERLDPAAGKDIDFLLSDEFVAQEKAMGARWAGGL